MSRACLALHVLNLRFLVDVGYSKCCRRVKPRIVVDVENVYSGAGSLVRGRPVLPRKAHAARPC